MTSPSHLQRAATSRAHDRYAPGHYALFFADRDGLKLELVHAPVAPELAQPSAGAGSAQPAEEDRA